MSAALSVGEGARPEVNSDLRRLALRRGRARAQQVGHPARDRRRGIEPVDRPRRELAQARRAAADNACRRAPQCRCGGRLYRQSRARSRRRSRRPRRASPASSASAKEASRGEPTSATSQSEANSRISARVYSRLTVPACRAPRRACVFDCAQAGLIAGTVPTKGTVKRARNSASASVEAVLQAMTTRSGAWSRDRVADHVDDARDQRCLRHVAVGKAGVVGDIDVTRIGPRRRDLAEHGEAAEAGIENKIVGAWVIAPVQARAEHALEDRIDVLEMVAEVEIGLELLVAELRAHVLVGLEQRQEIALRRPRPSWRCAARAGRRPRARRPSASARSARAANGSARRAGRGSSAWWRDRRRACR